MIERPVGVCPEYVNPALGHLVRDVDSLREDPHNARVHPPRNLDALKRSLASFRQQKPVIAAQDGTVIAGNATLRVAKLLGWTRIAAIDFEGSDEAARAFALADNRSAELATWDDDELGATLETLRDFNPELLDAAGFDDADLQRLLMDFAPDASGGEGKLDSKAVPEPIVCPECGHEWTP